MIGFVTWPPFTYNIDDDSTKKVASDKANHAWL